MRRRHPPHRKEVEKDGRCRIITREMKSLSTLAHDPLRFFRILEILEDSLGFLKSFPMGPIGFLRDF